jgi:hypothetical protein
MASALPVDVRARLERAIRWRPESYEAWWSTPIVRYGWRRPCDLDQWELEEALRKVEEAAESAARQQEAADRQFLSDT